MTRMKTRYEDLKKFACALALLILVSCSTKKEPDKPVLFTEMDPETTGIIFENKLDFDKNFNIFTYRNYYNGGGVALGDVNNDGLIDIYFTSNLSKNKLYLNKGNFRFEDITDKALVAGTRAWSTGVNMADVNGDGLIDIYVCNSGDIKGDNKQNELFINNGNLTFTEKGEEYGVADKGYTTHSAFFDYDNDGDLDLYVLNNSSRAIGSFNLRKNERDKRNESGGDKLLRNDGNRFTDVSQEAGIFGSAIGFGLGVTVGDINKDGWQDISVANDFFERDYLYINNQDGTFRESLPNYMKSISVSSMGADLADINNDGWADIFVTEMLPLDHQRYKTIVAFEDWNRYQDVVINGYYHQFSRNMLQLNNGDDSFSEIGRLAGVEASDWSWGALIFDMDNDGLKDIFVANGIYRDLTNQDFLKDASNEEFVKSVLHQNSVDYKKLTEMIPSNPIPNSAFHNEGAFSFKDRAAEFGLGKESFSNGSAFGDLDNDGDLDIVVNNVNMTSFVYKNNSEKLLPGNHYLKFELAGKGKNTYALGTKILIKTRGDQFYIEQMPMRGYESSMDTRPNIGLGKHAVVDSVIVIWPDGKATIMDSIRTNQTIRLSQADAKEYPSLQFNSKKNKVLFQEIKDKQKIDFVQKENVFVDFDRDFLIYQMLSTEGPRIAVADVNGDKRDDFYIGGPKDQPGSLYIQNPDRTFKASNVEVFEKDKMSEDMGSTFFDADGDGDDDLYVCSGGSEFSKNSPALLDRLYLNDAKGNFSKVNENFSSIGFQSSSTVKASDFDYDGDVDLFVGIRLSPFSYGTPQNGYLLSNDGRGKFTDVTQQICPALIKAGMITDALWADIDSDKDSDLIVVGEYMPIKVFRNDKGNFMDVSQNAGLSKSNGWWNRVEAQDLDHDGDLDFVVGNHGLNSKFKASIDRPVNMYVSDFDQNGTIEQIICTYHGDESYPVVLRHDLVAQIPSLKKKYLKYESYKDEKITDIFTEEQLSKAIKLDAYELSTVIMINEGNGRFTLRALPVEAQFSPVFGIEIGDFNDDSNMDILLGGNMYKVKPQVGRYDASYGTLLIGDGKNNFKALAAKSSGIKLDGEVRDIVTIKTVKNSLLLISRNNDSVLTYEKK
jgi:enediyne biosynthesis protein E4